MSAYPLHDELLRSGQFTSNDLLLKVKTLIDAGTSVNERDNTKRTPLECCLSMDNRLRSVEACDGE